MLRWDGFLATPTDHPVVDIKLPIILYSTYCMYLLIALSGNPLPELGVDGSVVVWHNAVTELYLEFAHVSEVVAPLRVSSSVNINSFNNSFKSRCIETWLLFLCLFSSLAVALCALFLVEFSSLLPMMNVNAVVWRGCWVVSMKKNE